MYRTFPLRGLHATSFETGYRETQPRRLFVDTMAIEMHPLDTKNRIADLGHSGCLLGFNRGDLIRPVTWRAEAYWSK